MKGRKGERTHRPLESAHQRRHDRRSEHLLSGLRQDLGRQNLESRSGVSHHLGLPENRENVAHDRVDGAEREADVVPLTAHEAGREDV